MSRPIRAGSIAGRPYLRTLAPEVKATRLAIERREAAHEDGWVRHPDPDSIGCYWTHAPERSASCATCRAEYLAAVVQVPEEVRV